MPGWGADIAGAAAGCCLICYHVLLLAAAAIDARERRAPNALVAAMLAVAAAHLALSRQPASWVPVIACALAVCGLLVALEVAWRHLRGSIGLGMGDVKVLGTTMLLDPASAVAGFIGALALLAVAALALRKPSLPFLPFFFGAFIAAEVALRAFC